MWASYCVPFILLTMNCPIWLNFATSIQGVCDTNDGQCACKGNIKTDTETDRTCNECKDGFFGLSKTNGLGCDHCQCDVGGTEIANRDEMPVCDKENGQCQCRNGIKGKDFCKTFCFV